jgi:hypothetical protein
MKLKIKMTNSNHNLKLDFWNYWKSKREKDARERDSTGPVEED